VKFTVVKHTKLQQSSPGLLIPQKLMFPERMTTQSQSLNNYASQQRKEETVVPEARLNTSSQLIALPTMQNPDIGVTNCHLITEMHESNDIRAQSRSDIATGAPQ
jgi:hypothetical protein